MYLQLLNVKKSYDGKVAVDNLSLDIPRGAIYGLIGPNGAGKTTTIRMIMSIILPDSGQITFNDKPIDASFKDRVGYLPEERGLYRKMTLTEVITYMASLKSFPSDRLRREIRPWLERMGLLEYENRKVEELSKGMAQKLQFITTILHDPEVVIFDELFSGLDPINIELIKDVLMELKQAGKTIIFSTHVMEQAEKLCDYICMISHGKMVLNGTLHDVRAKFGKNSIQMSFEGDGAFIRTIPGVKEMIEFNNYVEIRLNDEARPDDILKAVVGRIQLQRFECMEPSLYDIFIDLAKVREDAGLPSGGEAGA